MEGLGCILQHMCCCTAYAEAAAVFYKKSFNRSMIPSVLYFLAVGLLSDNIGQSPVSNLITCLLLLITCYRSGDILRKTLATFTVFFVVLLDIRYGFVDDGLTWLYGFRCPVLVRMFMVAFPQFLRSPAVKAKLQGVRAKAGPVYVLYTSQYAVIACLDLTSSWHAGVIALLSVTSAVSAVLAGIVFRPDNSAILELVYPGTKLRQRKLWHRYLMITSCVCTFISEILIPVITMVTCFNCDVNQGNISEPVAVVSSSSCASFDFETNSHTVDLPITS